MAAPHMFPLCPNPEKGFEKFDRPLPVDHDLGLEIAGWLLY
jgi:hypothetical protein